MLVAGSSGRSRMTSAEPLLKVEHLRKYFPVHNGPGREKNVIHAVDDVSFELGRGDVLGLVGESGCGKSTLGMTIAQLERATAGRVVFDGVDLTALRENELRVRRRRFQVIFQDPYSSLDPRMKVAELIAEPLHIMGMRNRPAVRRRVEELLDLVRLDSAFHDRYTHELSGGQRQRVGIARALALEPDLLICDEPVSALDVSIQAQIINLLLDLRRRLGLTYIFIAHDVAAVVHMSDRVAVMYLGRFVEVMPAGRLATMAMHPYTRALIAAVPVADPAAFEVLPPLQGEVPDAVHPPSGCRFRTRCPQAQKVCAVDVPELHSVGDGHSVACHFAG